MSHSLRNQYDMVLTIGSKDYGYQLWTDPNGQKHWNEGLAPLIAPQQRITEFSYEHIPPEIDMPAAFENWSMGAGYTEFLAKQAYANGFYQLNSNTPKTYNYAQGVDASWENRLYLSPDSVSDLVSTGGEVAAAPTFFFNSLTFGMWAICAQYMYKYDLTSASWVLKNTASAAVRSMTELNGVLYASVTSAAYIYSTDGTSWTAFSDANLNSANIADLFVVRGNVLMAMRSEKAYVTTNGQNGGVAWSAATQIGSTSETTQSLVVANNEYWIFKREGVYNWDGTTVSAIWNPKYLNNDNGKSAYVWYDGKIYTVYNSRLLSIDPFNTQESSLTFVYPLENRLKTSISESQDSVEVKGTISQITGSFTDLYFVVTNANGASYLMKGDPQTGVFHTWVYLGTNTSSACIVVGTGVQHATNPTIAVGVGTSARHYILARDDLRPEDDPNYKFTSTGTLYGPWLAFGARAFNKFLNRGTVLTVGATAGMNITLSYQLDDDSATTTELLDAINNGINSADVDTTVSFYRIRYVLTLNTVSNASTPIVVAATLHATLNPPRRRVWKPLLILRDDLFLTDGLQDTQSATTLRNALYTAATSRVTMKDRLNGEYIVRVLDIQEVQLKESREGGDESDSQVLQVTLAEISPLHSAAVEAHYNQARYAQGYRYD